MKNKFRNNSVKYFTGIIIALTLSASAANAQDMHNIDSLKSRLNTAGDTVKISTMLALMKHYSRIDSDSALQYGKKALGLSQSIGYSRGIALSLSDIGRVYNMNGKIKQALAYYKKALAIRKQIGNQSEIAGSLNNIGAVYFNLADYPEALKYFLQSLAIRKSLGNQSDISASLNNIGSIYMKQGNLNQALHYFKRAMNIRNKIGPEAGLAETTSNIAYIYMKQKDYEKALDFYIKTLRLRESTGDKSAEALTFNNIGLVYLKLKNYNYASVYLFKSLEIRTALKDQLGRSESLNNIAISYRLTNDLDKSILYSEKSLKIAKDKGAEDLEKSALQNLSLSYAELNNYKKAYYYQNKIIRLSDTLYNIKKLKQINNLQTSYESDKNELQTKLQNAELKRQRQFIYLILGGLVVTILLTIFLMKVIRDKHKINLILEKQTSDLKEKQDIINQKNKDLEESNAVKDKLFAIIGHDLRSPFANLKSMLDLIQSGDISQDEFKEFAEHLNKRTESTAILIDNLLNWAMAQQDGYKFSKQKINIKNIIDENIDLIKKTTDEKGIRIVNYVDPEENAFADPDTIRLVIRNLITNAGKFTKRNGKISISTVEVDGMVEISVKDNGVGIDEKSINKLFDVTRNFSMQGTNGETGSGLGLKLCREFVEKNNGKIWVESKLGEGSIFRFTLQKS